MSRRKVAARVTQLKQFQNRVRGSDSPIAAVSQVRGQVHASDLQAFVDWLPSVRRNARGLFTGRFPSDIRELNRIGPLAAVGFEREVAWAASIIRQNAADLSAFVAAAVEYESCLLTARLSDCKAALEAIERRFGISLWGVETRLALLQLADGLEAQKSYAAQVCAARGRNDSVAFMTYHASQRNEPTTTPTGFVRQIEDKITVGDIAADFKAYLLFHVANRPPKDADDFAGILRRETTSALVDQYDTFVRLCQHAAILGDERVRKAFTEELKRTANVVDDERLRRTVFLLSGDAAWLARSNVGENKADDAAVLGRHDVALAAAEDALARNPLDVDLWVVKAQAMIGTNRVADRPDNLSDAEVGRTRSVIGKLEDRDEAAVALLKDGLNHRLLGFAAALEALVWKELSSAPEGPSSALLAFTQGRYLRPRDVARLPSREHRLALASTLAQRLGACVSLYDQLIRADLESEGSLLDLLGPSPPPLPLDALLDAKMDRALTRGDHEAVLDIAGELLPTTDLLRRRKIKRYIGHSLLQLGRIEQLVSFIAESCVDDPELASMLPVRECAERLDKGTRKRMAGSLAVPILLDLFSKRYENRLDDVRSYSYEDFLLAHGLERPSELERLTDRLPSQLLIYYLRHVCIPDVMQVSSTFRGTRELEDERKSVLSLLVKLDPESAKDYETELRDVTRAQLIHRGVRQVERSKLYVDVPAIRRLFEKKHRETFNRYQALVRAGIGASDPELAAALQDVLSGKPLPQQVLEVPKNEANDLLLQMLSWLFAECTTNPEHGLDCYLSMRIRHGTFSGQLRTPLELEQIITQRAAGTDEYESNRHWLLRLSHLAEVPRAAIAQRLARFSSDYDAFIARIAKELIQIKSSDRPKGLFNIGMTSVRFRLWVADLTGEITFETFFEQLIELFWESVESSLGSVRGTIDKLLKPEVTTMFAELERDIDQLSDGTPTSDLDRAIRTAQTGTLQALDLVKDWFRLSQPITEPDFPIEDLIDVGLQCVKTIHRDFAPVVIYGVPPLPPFAHALVLFSDIFFIIFDNIRRHSGKGLRPRVIIDIRDGGDRLLIVTRSEISPTACNDATRARIARIKDAIASGEYQRAVSSEGGTGLIKLRKLIGNGDRGPRRLDFRFSDENSFIVELELAKTEIQR